MKRLIINDSKIYSSTQINDEYRILNDGQLVELGEVKVESGIRWIEVIEENKIVGYVCDDVKLIDPAKHIFVYQPWVDVHSLPSEGSSVLRRYKKFDEIYIVDKFKEGQKLWYKIYDIDGNSGYIESDTNLLSESISKKQFVINQDYVDVYENPDKTSDIKSRIFAGHEIVITNAIKNSNKEMWFEICTPLIQGYIPESTFLEDYSTYKERQDDIEKNLINISPTKAFFLAHNNRIVSGIITLFGLIILIMGLILGAIYESAIVIMGIGIVSMIFDINFAEVYHLIVHRGR